MVKFWMPYIASWFHSTFDRKHNGRHGIDLTVSFPAMYAVWIRKVYLQIIITKIHSFPRIQSDTHSYNCRECTGLRPRVSCDSLPFKLANIRWLTLQFGHSITWPSVYPFHFDRSPFWSKHIFSKDYRKKIDYTFLPSSNLSISPSSDLEDISVQNPHRKSNLPAFTHHNKLSSHIEGRFRWFHRSFLGNYQLWNYNARSHSVCVFLWVRGVMHHHICSIFLYKYLMGSCVYGRLRWCLCLCFFSVTVNLWCFDEKKMFLLKNTIAEHQWKTDWRICAFE